MLQEERLNQIMNILKKKKKVKTETLAQELFCSISTLRRSLIDLEKNGLVKRVHGGVYLVSEVNNEFTQDVRENEHLDEKKYIAELATDFLSNSQSLFFDSSSTVFQLCKHLRDYNHLFVITNGLKTALALSSIDQVQVFVAGGKVKGNTSSVLGEMTGNFLKQFKVDLAFISCRGISLDGIYEADYSQALIKQEMIKHAKTTVLLVDDKKFNSEHFFLSATFDNISAIITNEKPAQEFIQAFEKYDCEIFY